MEKKWSDLLFDLGQNSLISELFEPYDNPWEVLADLKNFIRKKIIPSNYGKIMDYVVIEGDVFIGKGTVVEPGAYIKGPAIIGENCEIRQGAYIRGDVLVGNGCVVGHTTEVKNSVFMNGAKAGHFAYIGDSVLGNNVNLGAGTKLANLKITPGTVKLKLGDKVIDSNLRKFGALLGDNVQTGCNSVTSPGTILGKASMVFPCVHCHGVYETKAIIN